MLYRNGILLLIHISAVVRLSNGESATTIEAHAASTQHFNSDTTDANDGFGHTTPDGNFYPEKLNSINANELATERTSHAKDAASREDTVEQGIELMNIRPIADLKKPPSDNGVRLTNFMSSGSNKYDDFEEFTLSNEMVNSSERAVMAGDKNHVFKIGKGRKKSKLAVQEGLAKPASENDTVTSFQVFTQLFDHNEWNEAEIIHEVTWWCGEEMAVYLEALSNADLWAIKASDSSGRYRGQFFFGNDFWTGSLQFCKEVNNEMHAIRKEASKNLTRSIKHVEMGFFVARLMVKLTPGLRKPKGLQVGQCLPKSCTTQDVEKMMKLDPAAVTLTENRKLNDISFVYVKRVPGEYVLWEDRKFYLFAGICATFLAIALIASLYEAARSSRQKSKIAPHSVAEAIKITQSEQTNGKTFELYQMNDNNNVDTANDVDQMKWRKRNEKNEAAGQKSIGIPQQLLLCFSISTNARTILSVNKGSQELTCIHGLRLFSLLWTIMVHTYLQLFAIGENRFGRVIAERKFGYQIIGNASLSVDTFFFISGLLVTHLFLKTHKITKRPECGESIKKSVLLVVYRYFRLTPVYFMVIVFNELALKYSYDRSVFPVGLVDHLTCPKYWWRNVLYINNWYPMSEFCMIWSWYMANDMQLYIIAILLLVFSARYLKCSVTMLITFLVTSWVTSAVISLHFNYTHKVAEPFESFDFLYNKPWQRIGPYIMGMVTGYIIKRVKQPPKVPLFINLFLWLVSMGILFAMVFGVWGGRLSVLLTAFYVSLGHTAWGAALVWITLACYWGLAGPVNAILSYRAFLPLSRLTYCAYLLHPIVMVITSFRMQSPMHLQHGLVLTVFLGNVVISFIGAFVFSILFEAPVIKVLKVIFRS